jgi:hypothetical protein
MLKTLFKSTFNTFPRAAFSSQREPPPSIVKTKGPKQQSSNTHKTVNYDKMTIDEIQDQDVSMQIQKMV